MVTAKRIRRIAFVAGGSVAAVLAASTPYWAPRLGHRLEWLEVDRIEITGTRLLAPHEVLAASGYRPGVHLLDDTHPMVEALLANPVIRDVEIARSLPRTLRILVQEKVPVAFVADGELRPATASGDLLPIDPSAVPLDLPV